MADFTKDGAQVDEWAQIAVTTIREGAAVAIPDDIDTLLEITVCHDSANAHANGALVTVEVSGNTTGDEDWTPLMIYRTDGATAATIDVDLESTGTTLYVSGTSGFTTKMARYFVKNAVIANSEVVINNGYATDDYILLLDGLTNTQETTADVYTKVYQNIISIPSAFRRARVLVWNDDADCTICSRTRKALATDIE